MDGSAAHKVFKSLDTNNLQNYLITQLIYEKTGTLAQTKNGVAVFDDAVTMGDEDHGVVRKT